MDLIIVPGVAFDRENNRLGYGKGYYDRFLTSKDILKIGLAFSEQIVDFLECDNYDIPMDIIISDKKTFYKKL